MKTYPLGAVLALRSGSKDLTCVAIIEDGKSYDVAWHDSHGTPHTMNYPAEALELASAQRERQRQEMEAESRDIRRAMVTAED